MTETAVSVVCDAGPIEELEDRLRVTALKQKGEILKFVVQYEALIGSKWRPIIRYDTSHGFAHKDIIHYNGEQEKQPLYFPGLNMAFTYAIQELKISWRWYRMAYEKEMGKKYAFEHPDVMDKIPPEAELVILPVDDKRLCDYNKKTADKLFSQGKTVVLVRVKQPEPLVPELEMMMTGTA